MTSQPLPKKPRGPKVWCTPPNAFGKVDQVGRDGSVVKAVEEREWQPPSGRDPVEVAQFRAAVMQNAIAVYAREFKNGVAMRRTGLAALDDRLNSTDLWDARLNGNENMTTSDIATLLTVLPDAVPDPTFIANFIRVAEGWPRPREWPYPDTSAVTR